MADVGDACILVVADQMETRRYLVSGLLPQAGYKVVVAEDFTPPSPCDVVLVDVVRLRANPLASLKAQRRMGSDAPAILFAPRLTEQMAMEVFSLGVREFVPKPVGDPVLLEKLADFVSMVRRERDRAELDGQLEQTQVTLARRLEEMSTLSRIGRAIASLSDVDAMLLRIVEASVFLTRAEEGAIFLVDESSGELLLRAEQGLEARQAAAIRQPSSDSDAAAVLRDGKPIVRSGASEHKVKTGYLVRALINVPVVVGREVEGVLAVYSHGTRSFEDSDQAVLANLADYAAIALDKARSLARAEAQAESAVEVSRQIVLHTETLADPLDGILAQVETLLSGGFGRLAEEQHGAVVRIRQSADRIVEVVDILRQLVAASGRS